MSTHFAAGPVPSAPAVNRPATLLAALVAAAVGALATIGNAIVMRTGGDDLAVEVLASALGRPPELISTMAPSSVIADVSDTLSTRGTMALLAGVGLVVFALLMRKAATWSRVLVTIFAVLTGLIAGRVATDDGSTIMIVLGILGVLGAVAAIVLTWLPANGRYAKALKN
ncbi:hypothetical protein [Prauserella cavernicola]|uniref:Uncharacterized protein n=1 Tax=Prauserella cavernicola TaxID=2800127 RepID=A0A934QU74_9PSEU|nr:hypothetical protein [Prauserella cavernicola]MBK1785704.1 hypothetical protein [Prauserella cavernicola]